MAPPSAAASVTSANAVASRDKEPAAIVTHASGRSLKGFAIYAIIMRRGYRARCYSSLRLGLLLYY